VASVVFNIIVLNFLDALLRLFALIKKEKKTFIYDEGVRLSTAALSPRYHYLIGDNSYIYNVIPKDGRR